MFFHHRRNNVHGPRYHLLLADFCIFMKPVQNINIHFKNNENNVFGKQVRVAGGDEQCTTDVVAARRGEHHDCPR